MRRIILSLCTVLAFALSLQAQPGKRKEKIDALRIAFITQKLNLSSEEAKVFWPVYNKYQEEKMNLWKSVKAKHKLEEDDIALLTDKEAEQALNDLITYRQAEVDLLKKYTAEFKKVLPVKKVALLYKAEADFRKELLNHLKKNKR